MAITIYKLKPAFIALLRPAATALAARDVTANQVTVAACGLSGAYGLLLFASLDGVVGTFARVAFSAYGPQRGGRHSGP